METDANAVFRYIRRMMEKWVEKALAASGKSQAQLARELHARYGWADDRSVINKILKNRRELSAIEAMQISTVTGYALPTDFKASVASPLVSSFDPEALEDQGQSVGYSREAWRSSVDGAIPEIDGKLGAGEGQMGEVINICVGTQTISGHGVVAEWLLPLDYLRNEAKASPKNTVVMEVIGDSMTPTYQPGDRVLIDLSQNELTSDTVYAISDGQREPQIKRLQRVPFSDPPQVIIISDNPNLERFTVDLDRLAILGRICGVIARR